MMSIKNRSFRFVVLQVSLLLLPVVSAFFVSSCRMAPKDNPGDTVASSQFYPPDTAQLHRQRQADSAVVAQQPDSIDIFYVGEGSTRHEL
jgi:putative lipoprotein